MGAPFLNPWKLPSLKTGGELFLSGEDGPSLLRRNNAFSVLSHTLLCFVLFLTQP